MKFGKNGIASMALLALTAFLLLQGAVHASVNPKLVLQSYAVSSDPALPGTSVALRLHIENIDPDTCANRVSVQVAASYPLSVGGSDVKYLGSICPGDANGTVSFTLPVDSLAVTGTYPVSVLTSYEKDFNKFSESNTVNLRVGGSPSFTASVASSNPVDIYPGDEASITIRFQNNGAGRAESSRVTLSAPAGIDVKWAGSVQDLGLITARSSTLATFQIEAAKNAAPGIYALNATLEYLGENETFGSQSFSFDMPLKERAEFSADAKKNAPFVAGEDREIAITLKNTGFEEARKLKVRILPVFPFSTDGTVRYIDSLAPGEEKDLAYVIHIDKDGTAGEQTAGLLINFESPQGKKFADSIDFSLTLRPKNFGYYAGAYWPIIAALLIAALVIRNRKAISRRLAGKSR